MSEQPWELQDDLSPTESPYCEVIKEVEKLQMAESKRQGFFLLLVSAIVFF